MDSNIYGAIIGAFIPIMFQLIREYISSRKKDVKTESDIYVPSESKQSVQKSKKKAQVKKWRNTGITALALGFSLFALTNPIINAMTPAITATSTPTSSITPTYTLTQTETLTPTIPPIETFTPTATKIVDPTPIPDRPIDELTYCSKDILHPAGIRVIARWPKQNKRGFYFAVQKNMEIVSFRVNGWDYLLSTQKVAFSGETDSSVCGYDAQWFAWSDSNSTDPIPGSIITIEFLNANEDIVITIMLTVNQDGLGLTHIKIE